MLAENVEHELDDEISLKVKAKSLSRVRLCDPMDCSLPVKAQNREDEYSWALGLIKIF